ncbi:hypothetical protein BRX43_14030 [Sphingomonas sp. S-NIH.Pt15_0812]|nr:hypothetical protein BRX43_14030 [Sphingomonas sp. S-NIH.Pt15_0812]
MSKAQDRKRRYRAFYEEGAARHAAWAAAGFPHPPPQSPPFPADLAGLACGATTRRGHPCKRTDLHLNGRCKFHGGCSTGPRTPEGKARSLANLRLRWSAKA